MGIEVVSSKKRDADIAQNIRQRGLTKMKQSNQIDEKC